MISFFGYYNISEPAVFPAHAALTLTGLDTLDAQTITKSLDSSQIQHTESSQHMPHIPQYSCTSTYES